MRFAPSLRAVASAIKKDAEPVTIPRTPAKGQKDSARPAPLAGRGSSTAPSISRAVRLRLAVFWKAVLDAHASFDMSARREIARRVVLLLSYFMGILGEKQLHATKNVATDSSLAGMAQGCQPERDRAIGLPTARSLRLDDIR